MGDGESLLEEEHRVLHGVHADLVVELCEDRATVLLNGSDGNLAGPLHLKVHLRIKNICTLTV